MLYLSPPCSFLIQFYFLFINIFPFSLILRTQFSSFCALKINSVVPPKYGRVA